MNRKARNKESADEEFLYGMKKITYWEKYGLKHFPYPGRRRYTPSFHHSFDGGIIISNDVFGLTISQFEQKFRACLEKRTKQEQWILNLRYPDKSSNEYIEYLQTCTDQGKNNLLWPGNDLEEKNLYEHLIHTVGTEIIIRNRQRLFIIQDMIYNSTADRATRIYSGSLAEGLDLPGSDRDVMFVLQDVDVIQNTRNIKQSLQRSTVVMETDTDHPGFTRLKLVEDEINESLLVPPASFGNPGKCFYLSPLGFLAGVQHIYSNDRIKTSLHGPCFSDKHQTYDMAFCLRSKYLPYSAIPWAVRHRKQWPPNLVIDRIINYGCLLVPIGPKTIPESDILWRLSFSVAEKLLVHSFNFTQLLCYSLLKLTLKRAVNTNDNVKDLLCSYFLKTALFWVSEEEDIEIFRLHKLFYCFSLCLDKLISWINISYCPNYFIPEHNMFLGKINQSNNKILLDVLEGIKCGKTSGLLKNLFPPNNSFNLSVGKQSEQNVDNLDILFYRVFYLPYSPEKYLPHYYQVFKLVESLVKSEHSSFIIDICKYHYAKIGQHVAQLLQSPITINKMYMIHNCYHRHLKDGIKTDAVSGWMLYASFYYVVGQHDICLRLLHYVLARIKPSMLYVGSEHLTEELIKRYKQNIHSTLTLNERMKIDTLDFVMYLKNSSLIPEELKLVMGDVDIFIPAYVVTHFLKFLCYHHLGDIPNKREAISVLEAIVEILKVVPGSPISHLGLLGICYELSGDRHKACQCYDEAFAT